MRWAFARYPQPLTLVGALVLWEVAAVAVRPVWLPQPAAVAGAWWQLVSAGRFADLTSTVRTLIIGLALVFSLGTVIAVAIGTSAMARDVLSPYLGAGLAVPTTALIPVYILVWGLSDPTRVATVVSFGLVPLVVQWSAAAKARPSDLLEMARSFDASPLRRLWSIVLPASAPVLLTGVRIAVVQGIKGVVSAEILIGVIGIGKLLQEAIVSFDLPDLYAVIVTLAAVTFALYLVLERLERRAARRSGADVIAT
jgi:ABC-type nitrate/sulfonate/bicarbonate transport system permease component